MPKNRFLKIVLISTLVICGLCLLVKSFLAIHTYREQEGGPTVNLMLKLNPFGANFVREDTFEADMASPLRICTDEMMFIGQDTLEYIFCVPLLTWLLLLLLPLLAIWPKKIYPAIKKRWLIIGVIVLPLLVWVIWLFQSHSPGEKTYSGDRQYSYYIETYNYDYINQKLSPFYDTEYKLFIYDEQRQNVLHTANIGTWESWRHDIGFSTEDNRLYWTKFDWYDLPRPIDKKAARQEEQRVRAVRDSIRRENECERARQLFCEQRTESPITNQEVAYIQPIIQTWLDFYSIDLSRARQASVIEGACFTCPHDSAEDPYYWEFGSEDDSPSLVQMSYSPNKQRYVDMMLPVEMRDGVWYDTGDYDVDQQLYLVDRRQRTKNSLVYNGPSVGVEDIFWKGNDVFIMVGFSYNNVLLFQIDVYDIPGGTHKTYEALFEGDSKTRYDLFGSYHNEVYLSSRGIVPYKQ